MGKDGPRGDPMATPSVCLNILLLKLNPTSRVDLYRSLRSTSKVSSISGGLICTGACVAGSLQSQER